MAKKQLKSGLTLIGIAPNILLKNVENTAPFLFKGSLDTNGPERAYLAKLIFYKKYFFKGLTRLCEAERMVTSFKQVKGCM